MARYPLFIHHEVDEWVHQHRSLGRRADWLLAELAARGFAGRPKGVVGPARLVGDLGGHRWRRSGLGGFDYYAWWFEAGDASPFPPDSRVVRAVRPHDLIAPLAVGDPADYAPRSFEALEPLSEEQVAVVCSPARVRLAVGHPGTGKTGALLYAVLEEGRHDPTARLLYVTLSRGLADDARQFLAGLPELEGRVEVATYEDLLASWSPRGESGSRATTITDRAEEDAFLGFLADQPRHQLNPWQNARRALWAEVRARLIGRALPFPFAARGQPACEQPFLRWEAYRRQRELTLGALAAPSAWNLGRRFVEAYPRTSLQRRSWEVLARVRVGKLDRRLRPLGGLIVDEIQDLTLLQLAVLVEATGRMGGGASGRPCFIAAGDESQVVHPSGFDWGVCKDLLRERLRADPDEFQLVTNQRSPSPLVEASNRTAALYDELPREFRPQARVEAEKTEAANGRVSLLGARSDDPDLATWLERLRETPGSALVVCPGLEPKELAPMLAEDRFADLLYSPSLVKGLDRQYVVVWEASRALEQLREEVRVARVRGDQRPRYLAARQAIDELRVAVSRSNEILVFLDRADGVRDPLLAKMVEDGVAEETTTARLLDVLESRGHDPLERTRELLREAVDLLDLDLQRALRALERADAALEELHDPDARRQAHEQRIQARRQAAELLLARARAPREGVVDASADAVEAFQQAGQQLGEIELSYRALGAGVEAERHRVLAERYLDTPPGSILLAEKLPAHLAAYAEALAELPAEQRSALMEEPRTWYAELEVATWGSREHLRQAVEALGRLAELTGADEDRALADRLRERLVERLVHDECWREALDHLSGRPLGGPAMLAACYEGLGDWERAGDCRAEAGALEQALDDYRRAGALERAAELATRLGRDELARALAAAATLSRVGEEEAQQLDLLTEAERQRLADSLRRAADRLAPRGRPLPRHGAGRERRR